MCIAKKNAGINSSFTVRKISYGEGIERVLPLFSPQINKIEVVKIGAVRRSKLYYLRQRSGKSARIAEKTVTNDQSKKQNLKSNKSNPTQKKLVTSKEVINESKNLGDKEDVTIEKK